MKDSEIILVEAACGWWFEEIPRPVDRGALFHTLADGTALIECSDGAVFTVADIITWRRYLPTKQRMKIAVNVFVAAMLENNPGAHDWIAYYLEGARRDLMEAKEAEALEHRKRHGIEL